MSSQDELGVELRHRLAKARRRNIRPALRDLGDKILNLSLSAYTAIRTYIKPFPATCPKSSHPVIPTQQPMSNAAQISSPPSNPNLWRESCLSTRSLSYISTADGIGSHQIRASSLTRSSTLARKGTMDGESEYGVEMGTTQSRELTDIPELPDCVAQSPLFTLPREIRDRIYNFCLTSQSSWPVEWPTLWKKYGLQPQLLRTCKIVYSEAGRLLYTLNNMAFHHPSDANMFVHAITQPLLSCHIANLSLHIKAQDTRLWMPYLTSRTDINRNLKADFPNLKELHIRFRSNKWQHSLPPEANMKIWSEDSRLDEIFDGLRHVFLPDGSQQDPKDERELETYISNHPGAYPLDPSDPGYREQWLEIYRARSNFLEKKESTPVIKVVCACRVHATHFTALTQPAPTLASGPDLAQPGNGTGVIQQTTDRPASPRTPVHEGMPFRGFTAIDFRAGMKKLHDPDLGSANVAKTPYADKNGILLSLEIHCLDPKRDHAAEQRMG